MITAQKPNRTCITRTAYPSGSSSRDIRQVARGSVGVALLLLMTWTTLGGCTMAKPSTFWSEEDHYQPILDRQTAGIAPDQKEITPTVAPDLSREEYEKLGDSNAQQGEVVFAAVHYEKALEIEPSSVPTRYKVANLYLEKGKAERAYDRFHEILDYDFDYAPAYVGMGQSLLKMGRDSEAELEFRQALVFNPELWGAHNFLGIIFDRKRQHDMAIDHYQKALKARPGDSSLLNNLGMAYFLNNDYEQAAQMFQQVLRMGSKNTKIWNNLGLTYAKLGQFTEAYDAFQQGLDSAKAYNNLGIVMLESGDTARAMKCFEQAVNAQPTYYEKAHENLKLAKRALSRLPSIQERVVRQRTGACL